MLSAALNSFILFLFFVFGLIFPVAYPISAYDVIQNNGDFHFKSYKKIVETKLNTFATLFSSYL